MLPYLSDLELMSNTWESCSNFVLIMIGVGYAPLMLKVEEFEASLVESGRRFVREFR
jgi:hypothetical protein